MNSIAYSIRFHVRYCVRGPKHFNFELVKRNGQTLGNEH